ncbi:DoxX family protein [Deinococcus yavapaiensis]|uniref:DoxX-like protein n=1 Tax=Deinococcus yavapaiensis KR-236 TaxID=694435 RepID=A0A318RZX5_9DEIO|nr:DoxX family protein [Deinococcus yavapaiensis]PYE49498.1 DoxX-like protein [Deinococcus yavapaiensis KR-236]
MHIVLWVLQVLLALAFLASGLAKLSKPKNPAMAWTADFDPSAIRLIGAAEVLGGLGLILPAALGVLTWLTPVAALALAALMLGAVSVHLRRRETPVPALVLALLALLVFAGRFWVTPFNS